MVWFRVDDNFADHPKVRRIPRGQRAAAIGLWTLAGTWAARHLRDGHVPDYMIDELCARPSHAEALVRVDLWHKHGHNCADCPPVSANSYVFHDWESLQYTREQVLAKREADAERQRLARERRKSQRESQDSHAVTDTDEGVSHATVHDSRPVPSRPVPTEVLTSEGDRPVTLRAVPETKPSPSDDELIRPADARCSAHVGVAEPGPCKGCRAARERAERKWEAAEERRRAADEELARNCVLCEGTHFVLDADKNPTAKKCTDHRRSA